MSNNFLTKGNNMSTRNQRRVVNKTLTKIFPNWQPPKPTVVDMSKIENPLETSKIVKPKIMTLKESIEYCKKKSPRLREIIETLQKRFAQGHFYDKKKIGQLQNRPIGLTTFNGITQRLVDPEHIADILEDMNESLLSPIFSTIASDGTLPAFDTMHGSNAVGIIAQLGGWGNNPDEWESEEFPFFIINNQDPFFADEAAYRRNGKGQKKWSKFDYHRIMVAAVRRGLAVGQICKNDRYILAEELQTLCEELEAIPLPDKHEHAGKAGTLGRIADLEAWAITSENNGLSPLAIPRFILETHKKYWHGTYADSQMFGVYGHLYLEMKKLGAPMKGKKWEEFLDRLHSVIAKCFTDLSILRTRSDAAYEYYYKNAFPALASARKTAVSTPHDVPLCILLKIMKELGETHQAINCTVALSYVQNGCNIIDYLDDDIKNIIETA